MHINNACINIQINKLQIYFAIKLKTGLELGPL